MGKYGLSGRVGFQKDPANRFYPSGKGILYEMAAKDRKQI